MIKVVAFDLDHTLFDRYKTLKLCIPFLRERFKLNDWVTDEYFAEKLIWADKSFVHLGWERVYENLVKCDIFEEEPGYELYQLMLLACFKRYAVRFPFTIPVLEELRRRGYKLALISNGYRSIQQKKLEMLGIADYFSCTYICEPSEYRKPHPIVFNMVATVLECSTSEIMFVGDHPHYDVDGSRKAGCVPVWVKTTGTWVFPEIEKPEIQIDTIEELLDIL